MKPFTLLFSGLITVALTESIPVAHAGTLTNGSFELPGVPTTQIYLNRGDTNLTGWTIGGTGGFVSLIYGQEYFNHPPADGNFQITFNAGDQPAGTWIEQTFDTIINEDYVVTFQVGRLGTQPGSVSIVASARSAAGELLADFTAIPPSQGYGGVMQMRFTAKSALTTLRFLDTSVDTDSVDIALDNVAVALEAPQVVIAVSEVALCWESVPNRTYQVQYRFELTENSWVDLGSPVVGTGATLCARDAVLGSPRRFYRVVKSL